MDNAELYVEYNAVQKKEAAELIAEFSSKLSWTEDEHVLDVGCGPGDVSTQIVLPHLPKNISSFVGVDLSSNMIKFANEKYSNELITFKTVDFGSKEINKHLPEKHFTKIFSFYCLHWIQDQKQVAENLFTLLKPGGEFLAVLTLTSPVFLALKLVAKLERFKQYCENMESVIPPMYYLKNPSEELKKILTAQGLDVIKCEMRMNPFTFPNLDSIKKLFEAINPFVKKMPEDVKEDYMDTLIEIFINLHSYNPALENPPKMLPSGEIYFLLPVVVVFARSPRQA